jgi:hypothetical protein
VPAGIGLLCYFLFPHLIVTTLAGKDFAAAAPLIFPYGLASTSLSILNTLVFYRIGIHRFAFRIPLMLVVMSELIAISLFHHTSFQVISILTIANMCGILTTLHGVRLNTTSTAKP